MVSPLQARIRSPLTMIKILYSEPERTMRIEDLGYRLCAENGFTLKTNIELIKVASKNDQIDIIEGNVRIPALMKDEEIKLVLSKLNQEENK